jgi:thiol peroxidase
MALTERKDELTFKNQPVTLLGDKVKVGDKAPDFELMANDWSKVTLADSAGKVRLISVVPSLDTGVCDAQTRRFNEEGSKLGDNVVIYTVSADSPFSQKRWCGAAGIERVQTLSDHQNMSFGDGYGTHIKELRLDQRSVFIIDAHDVVRYIEYVPIFGQHPNYEAALGALQEVLG